MALKSYAKMALKSYAKAKLRRFFRARPFLTMDVLHSSLSGKGEIKSVDIVLREDCALGKAHASIRMLMDSMIMPEVLKHGHWEIDIIDRCAAYLSHAGAHHILDIGANCGLFTRQLLLSGAPVKAACCVEADSDNSKFLEYNLKDFPEIRIFNVGLGDRDATVEFYRDASNHGNCSFAIGSIQQDRLQRTSMKMVEASAFFHSISSLLGERILLKCDVQGYDELVLSRIPDDIWRRVQLAMIEITQIEKPSFDGEALHRHLSAFIIEEISTGKRWSADEVLHFSEGRTGTHTDFVLTRPVASDRVVNDSHHVAADPADGRCDALSFRRSDVS
jgi:FkbM family methyltransferase